MKIWLDDERPMPPYYDIHCKTGEEAIELIKQGKVTTISLDHDLGDGITGYDVACFIEQAAFNNEIPPIRFRVHTQNIAGRKNICMALQNATRYWRKDVSNSD